MVPKIAWVLAPLVVYCALLALAAARGRLPSRQSFNVQTSLLLIAYLLTTAGLGIFWVANQQLPVFDWHYLFGYCTVLLVSIHLWFNFPIAWRWLRGPKRAHAPAVGVSVFKPLGTAAALVAAFLLGTRQSADIAAPLPVADAMVR